MPLDTATRSIDRVERANHGASVHDACRIESSLDAPHHCDAARIFVLFQKMPLEATDAMLGAERAPESRRRVVQPQRQARFDEPRKRDPSGPCGTRTL